MTSNLEVARTLADATRRLTAVSASPRLDAELLLAHALGVTREAAMFGTHNIPSNFAALVQRRLAHVPIAYIIGERDFWTLTLCVTPDVLIPRPDSETLIEAAIAHFGDVAPQRILDLGTGSGALLLAALDHWRGATGVGIDASPAALGVAQANADRLGLAKRASFKTGDWADDLDETFDLILCNPPYVEDDAVLAPDVFDYEPRVALFAGADGLDAYRALIPQLSAVLAPTGIVALEIGWTQAAAVGALAMAQGFTVACRTDLAGRDRCLVLCADKGHLSLGVGAESR